MSMLLTLSRETLSNVTLFEGGFLRASRLISVKSYLLFIFFWKVMLYLFRKMREIYEAKCIKQT